MTCKDCMHYDICLDNGDDAAKQNAPNAEEECDFFKNKADFVEVTRCKNCYNSESVDDVLYCNYFNKNVCEDGFCSQG